MRIEKILVVEDEPVVALDLQQTLEEMGHEVCSIRSSVKTAIEAVELFSPTLVLMDINLQGAGDGIDACQMIYQRWQLPVIFLTAFTDVKTVNRAAACKPFGYLMKPYMAKELYAVMQVARSRHDAEMQLVRSEERLALAVEAAQLGIWEWESQVGPLLGDPRFGSLWGNVLHPFLAGLHAMMARIHPDDRAEVEGLVMQPGFFNCIFRATRDNGELAWLEMYGHARSKGIDSHVVVGAVRDITSRKLIEERLRQANVVFTTIAEGIMILDGAGCLVSVNPAFSRLTGYAESEVKSMSPVEFLLVQSDSDPSYAAISSMAGGAWSSEAICKTKDGRIFNALQQICVVHDEVGTPVNYVHTISDLTAIRSTERQLVHLAYHDPLTKLPNRRLLLDRLKQAMATSDRSGQAGALLFIDLDDFKTLNDTLGHDMGDLLLEQVAARLLSCVREGDTVARLGGDEFMVMLEQLGTKLDDAAAYTETVGKKIIATLDQNYQLATHDYHCTPSIGATLFEGSKERLDELIKQADIAMYQSKHDGRNTLSFFDPRMQQSVNKRAGLDAEMHKALQTQQFQLHYQVQVDAWHKPIGAEALIRWNHPELGNVSPAEFIPLAEETGFIISIGTWVLETACAQLKAWQHHPKASALMLAVNVSAKQLRQRDFVQQVSALLTRFDVAPNLLKLEITEGMLLDNIEGTIQTMLALKSLGVQFSLDDFGTGYSSLQYLKRLPLDQLKIDRSFVQDLAVDKSDRAIVRTIITMAQSLNLDVIAEGVETEAQKQLLRKKGCIHYQGYLFGKPVGIEQFEAFLA
jgi:diguanylate cyclase (GGDEF)-like protein/PAS domain S-box-containing protein